jgi:hypothetical protein
MLYRENEPSNRPLSNYTERENSRNTIIVTLNGQRHGTLEKNLISRICRLPRVAETLIVQVVVDGLNKMLLGELNTSSRGQLVQGSSTTELIQNKLIDCLKKDQGLIEWEKKLSELHSAEDDSIDEVKQILDQLLDVGIDAGIGTQLLNPTPQGVGTTTSYTPSDPPTILDIATKEDPIVIKKGETKRIIIELNAKEDVFKRRNNRGKISYSVNVGGVSVFIVTNQFKDGRLPAEIEATQDSKEYETFQIKFIFDSENLPISLEKERTFIIVPQPIYEPVDPPTELKFMRGDPIELQLGKDNNVSLAFNGPNDILTRLNSPAQLTLNFDYPHCSLIRRMGPNNGRIQYTLHIQNTASINDSFIIKAELKLGEFILSDQRLCRIIPAREPNPNKGDNIKISRPNYQLKPVRKEDWNKFNWNEENIGLHDLKNDETNRECLFLYVNIDSSTLDKEKQRRIRMAQSQNLVNRIETKYVAHIAYHLFQQFDAERKNGAYATPTTIQNDVSNPYDSEQKEDELKRVAKTLILAFRGITDRGEN